MSDSPRDDLADLTRALLAHVAWQRDLGALELSRSGALPLARSAVATTDARVEVDVEAVAATAPEAVAHPIVAPPPPIVIASIAAPPAPVVRPLFAELAPPTDAPRVKGAPLEGEARIAALKVIQDEVAACTSCRLSAKRTNTVFSRGDPFARLCFIGEGPGEQEDRQGSPFVGPAGQLLDKIVGAMGLARDDVYVCNVVKCRPPNNRQPEPDEMSACSPFLARQLELVRPEVIVALGRTAVSYLLNTKDSMTRLRGRWTSYEGIPVLPTWHPAYLLRTPEAKADTWADMKLVMARLGLPTPTRG